MHILLCLVALVAALGAANPVKLANVEKRTPQGGFRFPVHRGKSGLMKAPAKMVVDTMKKYHKHVRWMADFPTGVIPSTVSADPILYDKEYLAPIHVGGQPMLTDIDTGSSDFWVFSTLLAADQQVNHSLYNPAESGSSRLIPNSSWSVEYGDGSTAEGVVYTDCLWVGETAVENQGVEVANYVSDDFVTEADDGILGLGFNSLNQAVPPQMTFLENAVSQGLPSPVFTADLRPNASGSYDFGFIDESKYSGELVYNEVDSSDGFWVINMTGWAFGSAANQTRSTQYLEPSVVDTGTSIVFLSQNVVRGYWATVAGAVFSFTEGGYVYPCNTQLPDFTFVFGTFQQTVPGRLINYSPSVSNPNMCFGGIQSQAGLEFNILGDVFLKTVFAVFDQGDQPKVGFAAKAQ